MNWEGPLKATWSKSPAMHRGTYSSQVLRAPSSRPCTPLKRGCGVKKKNYKHEITFFLWPLRFYSRVLHFDACIWHALNCRGYGFIPTSIKGMAPIYIAYLHCERAFLLLLRIAPFLAVSPCCSCPSCAEQCPGWLFGSLVAVVAWPPTSWALLSWRITACSGGEKAWCLSFLQLVDCLGVRWVVEVCVQQKKKTA